MSTSAAEIGSPAGTPSRIPTSPRPCDSPAVVNRKVILVSYAPLTFPLSRWERGSGGEAHKRPSPTGVGLACNAPGPGGARLSAGAAPAADWLTPADSGR